MDSNVWYCVNIPHKYSKAHIKNDTTVTATGGISMTKTIFSNNCTEEKRIVMCNIRSFKTLYVHKSYYPVVV